MVYKIDFGKALLCSFTLLVTSKRNDELEISACYGTKGLQCTAINIDCGQIAKRILITKINLHLSTISQCYGGISSCPCCKESQYIPNVTKTYPDWKLNHFANCSWQNNCNVPVGREKSDDSSYIVGTSLTYKCVGENSKVHICEQGEKNGEVLHLIYSNREKHTNSECKCSLTPSELSANVGLYSNDVRLQSQAGECSGSTLSWGNGQNRHEEQCVEQKDYPNITRLNPGDTATWLSLFIQDVKPTMVLIRAKASSGNITVKCGIWKKDTTDNEEGVNTGAIVGGILGVLVIAGILVIGIVLWRRRKAKMEASTHRYEDSQDATKTHAHYSLAKPINVAIADVDKAKVTGKDDTQGYSDPRDENSENCVDSTVNDTNYMYIDSSKMFQTNPSSSDDYNHVHVVPQTNNVTSNNAYSHVKIGTGKICSDMDDYDHIVQNPPNSPKEEIPLNMLDDYDHISRNDQHKDMKPNNSANNKSEDKRDDYDHLGSLKKTDRIVLQSDDYDVIAGGNDKGLTSHKQSNNYDVVTGKNEESLTGDDPDYDYAQPIENIDIPNHED